MANMSNGFYMGQQGFAGQQSGYGQTAGHQQQYGTMFTSQQQTQQPPVVTAYKQPAAQGYGQFQTSQTSQSAAYGYGQGSQYNMESYQNQPGGYGGYGTNQLETGTSYGAIGQPVQRGHGRGRGRGRGRGGGRMDYHMGPKPIKATEIKAYIYAWCNQFKKKPEYTYETMGAFPKVTYKCTINVPGYPSSCKEAKSKKDAQTLAAWDFSETLVSMGKIGRGDLPHKPECVVKTTESANTQESKIGLLKPEDENKPEYGGWTSENARQRLNRFCMAERISCDFQNYSEGPCHSKVSISTLSFMIERADTRPLTVTVRASNKKTANSTCALQMVRLLYKEGLIERFGEKPGSAPKALKKVEPSFNDPNVTPDGPAGQKRKASTEIENIKFDENGNWTLETAKTRLSKFYQQHSYDFNEPLQCAEVGHPPNKQYQCQFKLEHEGQRFSTCIMADNKKSAQRKACLDMVIQLYKAGLILGNKGDRFGQGFNGPKRGRGNGRRGGLGRGGGPPGGPGRLDAGRVPAGQPIGSGEGPSQPAKPQGWDMAGGFKTFASM